ncbi:uncharacterized protein LOC135834438 [Planococcus citri]|uniref:uncharacterized protein LOC135834438 n=1 Tax=Planococcus citri TaxID=170843 RepID=UPI0031F92991
MLLNPVSLVILTASILHNGINVVLCDSAYKEMLDRQVLHFVDKSNLLVEFFKQEEWPYFFVTCPGRFGKTTNLDMIELFAQIEVDENGKEKPWNETEAYNIFSQMNIAQHNDVFIKHLARYPVIRLDLKFDSIDNQTDEQMMVHIRDNLKQTFEKYRWLLDKALAPVNESDPTRYQLRNEYVAFLKKGLDGTLMRPDIQQSFYRLARILFEYFDQRKVIILVDNYDSAAVHSLSTHQSHTAIFYEWIHEFFTNGFKHGQKYIQYGLITGTCSVSFYSAVREDIDNIWHHPFLEGHAFDGFCGFLEDEVTQVFDKYQCEEQERTDVRKYYNGYFTISGKYIYDPHSFTRYFQSMNRELKNYWPRYARGEHMIEKFLNFYGEFDLLKKSLDGVQTNVTIWGSYDSDALAVFGFLRGLEYKQYFYDEDDCLRKLFTFTLENGYLSYGPKQRWFTTPNEQTRQTVSELLDAFVEQEGMPSTHLPCSYTLDMSFYPFNR